MLRFAKMHGLGNDFVVFDGVTQNLQLTSEQLRFIADRRFGIGCDQILLVEKAEQAGADFKYRIFNADGGEVEQCGNGVRCFYRFVRAQGLTKKSEVIVDTESGRLVLSGEPNGWVKVNMGVPRLEPQEIPFQAEKRATRYELMVADKLLTIGAVSMGNPHAVSQVENVNSAPVKELGALIEQHARFPKRVNAGFMEVVDATHIRLRVFERGVGETLACGTGACAAVVVGQLQGLLKPQVTVSLPGGDLIINWQGEGHPVWMTGPAEHVFDGSIDLKAT
ncbi:MAG: diaminopimelate epimerase [Gammaproteobacteria bacterium]|nr:diaminopimelate epimerase [Gammaproteobacteria bacterium]